MKNNKFENFELIFSYLIKFFKLLLLLVFILIVLSGVYKVESNEIAVVFRFGKIVGKTESQQIKQPGLHFAFPFIIDEIIHIPVKSVLEEEIITHYNESGEIPTGMNKNGYLFTGDHNLILLKAKAKYTIASPLDYLKVSTNINNILNGIISGEITSQVSGIEIDKILTTGKTELADILIKLSQDRLNQLNCGIKIVNIELSDIIPPKATKKYFEEVNNAKINKKTQIQKAYEYQDTKILEAQTIANQYLRFAQENQSSQISLTIKEIAQFDGIVDLYNSSPQVVKDTILRPRTGQLLTKMGTPIILKKNSKGEIPYVLLP